MDSESECSVNFASLSKLKSYTYSDIKKNNVQCQLLRSVRLGLAGFVRAEDGHTDTNIVHIFAYVPF
jgi:hypothetical protein